MRVLDAFRPRGPTWSGQVISSPPSPSGGPFMTHLLPGGGVPRVHRARSPVPPRLPHFATPRSVHHLAARAAGAYPARRPSNAWSHGVPPPPGPCYWLVASGTPVGWRGGCLALRLMRGAVRHYCLGGGIALVVCARHSRPVRGGWGRCRVLCLPRFPLPAPRSLRCVWRAVPSWCPLSSLAGTPFHAVSAFRGLGPNALLVFPACPLCVCALALSRRPRPPPLPGLVWRAHLARSRCWALVGPFHAVRAPPRVLPWSRAPFGLLGGGAARSRFRLPGLGLRAPCEVGAGVGTRHQPHSARSCELALRAVGAARGCLQGAPLAWVLASGVGRSPSPDHSSSRACGRGQIPTGCECGECGRWDPSATPPRALSRAGFVRCGGATRAPGGAPRGWVWGVRGPALSRPWPLVLFGVPPGPTTHWLWLRGLWVWRRVPNPTARALASWLCALWGRHKGAPGWVPLAWASGIGPSPPPDRPSFGACGPAPLPGGCVCGGCGRGDLSPTPQRAFLRAGFARCGGGTRAPRGGRLLPGCGASGVGRFPTPARPSFGACGQGPLPTGCGCGGCGRGDPSPTPQRALLRAGFARCGGGTRAPLEGRLLSGYGASGVGRSPTPDRPSFGSCGRGPLPTGCWCGGCGRGKPSPIHHISVLKDGNTK